MASGKSILNGLAPWRRAFFLFLRKFAVAAAFSGGCLGSLPRMALCLLLFSMALPACAAQPPQKPVAAGGGEMTPEPASPPKAMTPPAPASGQAADAAPYFRLAPAWRPLAGRLAKDGLSGPQVLALLEQLSPTPTQSPMGRKIKELYRRQFMPRPKSTPVRQYYKGVVSEANARLCEEFIAEHDAAFQAAYAKYGVPPNIGAALLFVETRLGRVLGDVPENAFYTLASMAVSDKPADISQWLSSLPGYQKHLPWLEETMRKRADWAYNETRALVRHMLRDHIEPAGLPGSIYGAVGLCQFMPSNISAYGADGDGDGRVDLFNAADAIASLSNYLAKHGWKAGMPREAQHKALMAYNHSKVYANTILALADLVAGVQPPRPQKKRGRAK